MNRRMEYRMRDVEMESMLAQVLKGVPYDYERILKAWKIILCHQFHDILPIVHPGSLRGQPRRVRKSGQTAGSGM